MIPDLTMQSLDSPTKATWNDSMLDHRVPGLAVDPHSIEEAENIIDSFHMQVCNVSLAR
jgi:hypothetical protein